MDLSAYLSLGQAGNIDSENGTRFPENRTDSPDFLSLHPEISYSYLAVLCLFTVTGNIGNVLVIGAVFVTKKLRSTGNMFIANLALADLCVTTVVDPFSIVGVLHGPKYFEDKNVLCHLVASVCLTSCVCSMWNIGAIAVNRCIFICHHQAYRRIYTWKKTIFICFLLWVWCAIMEMPNFFGWGGHTFDMKTMACSYNRLAAYSYTLFFCFFAIGLPLVVVFISYLRIFLYVRATKRHLEEIASKDAVTVKGKVVKGSHVDQMVKGRKKEELQLVKTLFMVFVVFLICWLPYAVVVLLDFADNWSKIVYVVVIQMGHTNSSLNSVLYAASNKRFREGYIQFLSLICWPCRQSKSLVSGQSTKAGSSSLHNLVTSKSTSSEGSLAPKVEKY